MNKPHLTPLILAFLIGGCASTGAKKPVAGPNASEGVKPFYSEKSRAVTLEQYSEAVCPTESKWESSEWKSLMKLAGACVKAKDWVKVEKMANVLATRAVTTPWGPYYLGLVAENRRDYPRAIWMFELALKKAPDEGLFHYELGRVYWDLKDEAIALQHLKMASDLSPTLAPAHFLLGQMAEQRGESPQAENLWQRALTANPRHLPAILAMATLRFKQKNYVDSEVWFHRALELNPRSSKTRLALAQVQEQYLKNIAAALESYKQLKQLAAEKKLDEGVHLNLDDKIQSLQKTLSQHGTAQQQLTTRSPSTEKQVKK